MRALLAVPLLGFVIAAYLLIGITGKLAVDAEVFHATLASGANFSLRAGDVFILVGLAALFFEVLKAARLGAGTIIDHMLSTAVFVVALVAFLLVGYCGTGTFFLLMVMALIDVVAGFSVSIFSARRDYSVSRSDGL